MGNQGTAAGYGRECSISAPGLDTRVGSKCVSYADRLTTIALWRRSSDRPRARVLAPEQHVENGGRAGPRRDLLGSLAGPGSIRRIGQHRLDRRREVRSEPSRIDS